MDSRGRARDRAGIRQFRLDSTILTGERDWPGCDHTPLWSERVVVVLPDQHPLAVREELTWCEPAEEPFIVSEAAPGQEIHDHRVRKVAELGRHPEIPVQPVGRNNPRPLVATGRGLTLVSEAMTIILLSGTTYRPIAGELRPFSAAWSTANDNPAFRSMLRMAKAKAKFAIETQNRHEFGRQSFSVP